MTTAASRTRPVAVELDALNPGSDRLPERARETLALALDALMAKLKPHPRAGADPAHLHWCAELEGDSILSSEYLLMKVILAQEPDNHPTLLRIANHLRLVQRPDGAWGQYPGSPPDLSACVKAYLALKCFGDSPAAPHMQRARERILALGGAEKCNTFSTFYLACLGQVSWDACPAIPPEIALLPRWFPFHMDRVAAWTRTMILPLAICSALRPVRELPKSMHIDELFVDPSPQARGRARLNQTPDRDNPICWKNFFLLCDRLLKLLQRRGLMPLRTRALKAAERWVLDRVRPETTEGLGAIFPPMVYLQIALKALGYKRDHPVLVKAERDLDAFTVDEPNPDPRLDHVRLQPCFSPIWDTGIALYAATEAGLTAASDPRIARVCDWLLARQVRMTGDWVRNLDRADRAIRLGPPPEGTATAWAFEYHNDWYPDVDDTAMVAKALYRAASSPVLKSSSPEVLKSQDPTSHSGLQDSRTPGLQDSITRYRETARRAMKWLLAMQNSDGGWAAFDKTRDRPWMEAIPFADHNAMQDPSCADITGRTIESLITAGLETSHPAISRAVLYLLAKQEPEGCWWGRWGCNYLYGTWQALGGLTHAGLPPEHPAIQRAVLWVRSVQNADGGFGESANSYLDRTLMGRGPSTASQTAWGLACLLYAAPADDAAVERAVAWLCDHQLCDDKPPFEPARCTGIGAATPGADQLAPTDFVSDRAGAWNEHHFTGTGFPKVFYLRYNLYRHYFPVMSLARYLNKSSAK